MYCMLKKSLLIINHSMTKWLPIDAFTNVLWTSNQLLPACYWLACLETYRRHLFRIWFNVWQTFNLPRQLKFGWSIWSKFHILKQEAAAAVVSWLSSDESAQLPIRSIQLLTTGSTGCLEIGLVGFGCDTVFAQLTFQIHLKDLSLSNGVHVFNTDVIPILPNGEF